MYNNITYACTVEPLLVDPPRRGQPPRRGHLLMHGLMLLIQNNLRDRDDLSTRDRGNIPKCPLLGGSTVHGREILIGPMYM